MSVVLAFACVGLPGTVLAQAPPDSMTFANVDKNNDGAITEQEFVTAQGERMAERAAQGWPMRNTANPPTFAAFDQNGDGRLTPQEFEAGQQAQRQSRPGMGMGSGMGSGVASGAGK
ncbi:EF-hand domain-containing protein [uncultured Thiodictyon sp.]|uniref:EF-hand domain-containing protein n=1 Tax=uncultured Thiodictyon sp. TaxID=1846217 RepID=UPI0025D83EAB|nr:EF-hand domain-containing protein [uncultured Thiodictyon sp.]